MTDSNSTALRGALARAIKSHVEMKGLNGVQAAKECGIANSRMSTILRGQVEKISSDALVDILGTLGYRLDSVIGATEGHEFTLTLDEGLGLPKDIEQPVVAFQADKFAVINDNAKGKPFEMLVGTMKDGKVISSEVVMSNELEDSDPDANRVIADE
jgi:predicted XRE-type DNA-binding protein